MTRDEECTAEALVVERTYGNRAPLFVTERIGALVIAGDIAGVERWREIARKLDAVTCSPEAPPV